MASRRKEHQEDAKFRVFQIINENPQLTSREVAKKVGISNGSAFYLLTPKGIREKSLITSKFLERKKQEYELLKKEITELERDLG